MDQQKFLHLLKEALTADTNRVKAATAELKTTFYKSPEALPVLVQFLFAQELEVQVRQLAATQARSLSIQHWKGISHNIKGQIRHHLLQSTLEEPNPLIRNAAARVIAVVAKLDADKKGWPDLPEKMIIITQQGYAQQREVGTFVLHALLDSMGVDLAGLFKDLLALFSKTIYDPESLEVRVNTTRALSSLARAIEGEADDDLCQRFQATVPGMVAVLKESIDSGDEPRTVIVFEELQTILTCEAQLLSQHFRELTEFMATLGFDKESDAEVRTQALSFLLTACHVRKLKFQSLRIGEQLTMGLLQLVAERIDDDDLETEEEEMTPGSSALTLLEVMTANLPPTQCVGPLLGAFNAFANSPDPARRQTIVQVLGLCAEGAPEFMSTQLKSFFPGLLKLLHDSELRVREAAVKSVRHLADQIADDLSKEHEKLIQALFANISSSLQNQSGPDGEQHIRVVAFSCDALEALVDGMDAEDVTPYVKELVPNLITLFAHSDNKVKRAAIGAVGSMAISSQKEFMPHFQDTVNALKPFLVLKEGDEELTLRSMACDTMGNLAQAVGAEAFKDLVKPMMTTTVEGMSLGSPRLRETAFLFWSDMVKVYEDDFAPYAADIVQRLFECLDQQESALDIELGPEAFDLVGKEVSIGGTKVKVAPRMLDSDSDEEEMDDDDDENWDEITGTNQVAFEKEVAIECLANVFVASPRSYLGHLEKTVEKLCVLLHHEYEGIQKGVVVTLYRIYTALWELQEDKDWQPGLPSKKRPDNTLANLAQLITPQSLVVWSETDDRQVASEIANIVTSTLRTCGPEVITTNDVKTIIQIITSVVNGEHNSQQDMAGDGDDDDEDDAAEISEYDWQLVESTLDVLSGLAKALGPQFGEIWKIFEKTVLKYASGEKNQRIAACGVIAECIQGMGNAVTPYTSSLLKVLLHRLGDEEVEVTANAAFAIGILVQKSDKTQEIGKAYNSILLKLESMLQAPPSRRLDNAAGCVSRMIMKHKERVPLDDVLPALIKVLPLQEDYEENGPVYQMIVGLFLSGEPAMTNLAPQLIPILAQVMDGAEEQLGDEATELVTKLIKFIAERKPEMITGHPSLMAALRG